MGGSSLIGNPIRNVWPLLLCSCGRFAADAEKGETENKKKCGKRANLVINIIISVVYKKIRKK